MADENKSEEKGEDLTGFKKDVDTKFQSMSDQLKQMNEGFQLSLNSVADAVVKSAAQKNEPEEKYDSELTPKQFEDKILERVSKAIDLKADQVQQKQSALNSTLLKINKDYPEIADNNSEFSKKMVEIHSTLASTIKDTADGYEMAALQAASQLGVLPMSKRSNSDSEDFILNPTSIQVNRDAKKRRSTELPLETIQFADLMGIDVKDEKVMERIKGHAERPFGRYR